MGANSDGIVYTLIRTRGPMKKTEVLYELAKATPPGMAFRVALLHRAAEKRHYDKYERIGTKPHDRPVPDEQTLESGRNRRAKNLLREALKWKRVIEVGDMIMLPEHKEAADGQG